MCAGEQRTLKTAQQFTFAAQDLDQTFDKI